LKFILCVTGKAKFKFVQDGLDYYLAQIKNFTEIDLVEFKDQSADLAKESLVLLNFLDQLSLKNVGKIKPFLWDVKGDQVSSEGLAESFSNWADQGFQTTVMFVGGAYGFSENVRKRNLLRLSLSKLTFPHDLVRVLICEQIYRSIQIQRNSKYHHG
jgi:23S rRNA (pseudouridine1915-N3)-methyltransferase